MINFSSNLALIDDRARYYDPGTGRFLSEDPIGFESDINFYRYVLNNPLTKYDPKGLDVVHGQFTIFWCPQNLNSCPITMSKCLVANGFEIDEAEAGNLIQDCNIEARECKK